MVKKTAQGILIFFAMLLGAGGAQARDLFENIKLDVYGLAGGSTLVDPYYFGASGRLFHTRFAPGYKFSIGVDIPYDKFISFESGFTYGPNNLVLTNTNVFPHTSPGSVTVFPVNDYSGNLSAVVHAPVQFHRFQPYVEAGVEYDRFSPTRDAIASALHNGWAATSTALINHNNKFGFNFGGGVDRKLTRRLSLRIDVRDHYTSSPRFGLPNSYSPAVFPIQGHANNIVYTAGFVYHIGKF